MSRRTEVTEIDKKDPTQTHTHIHLPHTKILMQLVETIIEATILWEWVFMDKSGQKNEKKKISVTQLRKTREKSKDDDEN